MKSFISLSLLAALFQTAAPQNPTPNEAYVLQGTVVRADNGSPIPNVRVTFGSKWSVVTDNDGMFVMENITAGSDVVRFASDEFAIPMRSNGIGGNIAFARLTLDAQHPRVTLHVELVPVATISGRLLNPDGSPATNIRPQLLWAIYQDGVRFLGGINGNTAWPPSNDRGEYRLFGVPAGEYFMYAQPQGNPQSTNDGASTTYYPSSLRMNDAAPIKVRSGGEVPNIDIAMKATRTSPLSFTVTSAPGITVSSSFTARLIPEVPDGPTGAPFACIVGTCGAASPMTIRMVPDGAYTLFVTGTAPESDYFGSARVTVGATNATPTAITLQTGVNIKGHVTVKGSSPSLMFDSLPIALRSSEIGGYSSVGRSYRIQTSAMSDVTRLLRPVTAADLQAATDAAMARRPQVAGDGAFTIPSIPPAHYNILPSGITGGYLLDVIQDGKSILESGMTIASVPPAPIEVIVATNSGKVHGTVVNEKKDGMSFRTVVLVPDEPHRRNFSLYKTASTEADGKFAFVDVVPGNYKLFSWTSIPQEAWTNAEVLAKYEMRGVSVKVEAENDSADLHVLRIPFE